MYKILIKTCSASNNIWNFYQEDGVDYIAASLEDMKPIALTLLKKYGKKNIKIIDQMSGQDMDNADVYIYDSTDNYEELSNRPYINGTEIVGQLTLEDLGIQSAGEYATEAYVQEMMSNIEMPDVDLTGYATEEYVDNAIKEIDDNTIVVRLEKTTSSQTDAQKAIIQEVLPLLTSKNIIIQLYEKPVTTQSYVDMIYRTFYWRPLLIEDISTYTGSLYWYGEASPSIHILNDMAYNSKTQPYIIIKVENGIVTNIDGLGGGSAQYQASTEIDLLTKRYNKSWTPTQDYNPVHKKYVDDAIASIDIPETDLSDYYNKTEIDDKLLAVDVNVEGLDIYSDEERVIGRWVDGRPLYQKYIYIGELTNGITDTHLDDYGIKAHEVRFHQVYKMGPDGILCLISPQFMSMAGKVIVRVLLYQEESGFNVLRVATGEDMDVEGHTAYAIVTYTKPDDEILLPTSDYYPATKKYVDDAIAGVSGGSGGGADLTNYYTKAEVDALLQELRNEFVSANNNINDKLETIIYGGE